MAAAAIPRALMLTRVMRRRRAEPARTPAPPPHVEFVGWQTGAALAQLYQAAEMVVVPSMYEPFGLVALEAMACGRPAVASRIGGLAEVIADGSTGYLIPPGDYLSWLSGWPSDLGAFPLEIAFLLPEDQILADTLPRHQIWLESTVSTG